jgi:predicted Ser/Thr protein kinase
MDSAMNVSAIIRIDRASIDELAIYERNTIRFIKRSENDFTRFMANLYLNRIRIRQEEWAERNWKTHAVQQEFIQTMAKARITPPSF